MNGNGSLLAYLAPQIKLPQEDIATYSLCHIMNQSSDLRDCFTKILCSALSLQSAVGIKDYKPQVIGKEKERPDIVGFDEQGNESVICEAKFYAALTENQPDGYLKRLVENGGKGLVFLCPGNRIPGLWYQLTGDDAEERVLTVNGIAMGIVSWETVLNGLKAVSQNNGSLMLPDILELETFCNQIMSTEFIPFRKEDFGHDVARSLDRYYQLVDDVINKLLISKEVSASKKGLHSTPQWYGHSQYIRVEGIGIGVYFNREIWKQTSPPSPFSMGFFSEHKEPVERYFAQLDGHYVKRDAKGFTYIVLEPPAGLTRDEAAVALTNQVIGHVRGLKKLLE